MSLAHLLLERWAQCEADLRRYYGLRLADVVFGDSPITWRELRVLLTQLPEDSALKSFEGWTVSNELTATQAELTHALLVAVLGIGGVSDLPDPLRFPRPGEDKKTSKQRQRGRRRPKGDRVVTTLGELLEVANQ